MPAGNGLGLASASRPMKRTPVSPRGAPVGGGVADEQHGAGIEIVPGEDGADGGRLLRRRSVHLGEPPGEAATLDDAREFLLRRAGDDEQRPAPELTGEHLSRARHPVAADHFVLDQRREAPAQRPPASPRRVRCRAGSRADGESSCAGRCRRSPRDAPPRPRRLPRAVLAVQSLEGTRLDVLGFDDHAVEVEDQRSAGSHAPRLSSDSATHAPQPPRRPRRGRRPSAARVGLLRLPERRLGLQPVDQEAAGVERGVAVRRGDGDQHDAVARLEPAVAVDDRAYPAAASGRAPPARSARARARSCRDSARASSPTPAGPRSGRAPGRRTRTRRRRPRPSCASSAPTSKSSRCTRTATVLSLRLSAERRRPRRPARRDGRGERARG